MTDLITYRTNPHDLIAQAPLAETRVKSWIAASEASTTPHVVSYDLSAGTLLRTVCRAMGGTEERPSEHVVRFCGPATAGTNAWVVEMRGCPLDGWL